MKKHWIYLIPVVGAVYGSFREAQALISGKDMDADEWLASWLSLLLTALTFLALIRIEKLFNS
jgi:hypothetical protein